MRDSTFERISRRRLRRQVCRPSTSQMTEEQPANADDLTCPVCNMPVSSTEYNDHVGHCLVNRNPNEEDDEDEIDVDTLERVETYTWAGQTRVRATSLVQGGLRGQGFVTISNEDQGDVDIEGEADPQFGQSQYTESDLVVPMPETEAEAEDLLSRSSIQEALTGKSLSTTCSNNTQEEDPKPTKLQQMEELRAENDLSLIHI